MMYLIFPSLWFIMVDLSTVLQWLKIDPLRISAIVLTCRVTSYPSFIVYCILWICLYFLLLYLVWSSTLLLFLSPFFWNPASLWRGALSLLSSGHFKEAEQAQWPQYTVAPKRQQGECTYYKKNTMYSMAHYLAWWWWFCALYSCYRAKPWM